MPIAGQPDPGLGDMRLGRKIVAEKAPIAAPKATGTPGVFRGPDGKLQTNIPPPPLPDIVIVFDEDGNPRYFG